MKCRLATNTLALLLTFALSGFSQLLAASPQLASSNFSPPLQPAPQSYDSVGKFEGYLPADCTQQLHNVAISVSLDAYRLPAHIVPVTTALPGTTTPPPTHLLLLYPPGSKRPSDKYILKRLKGALARNWLVSVTRSDGSQTPYGTGASLAHELAAASRTHLPSEQANHAWAQSLQALESFSGRRILLVDVSKSHKKKAPGWMSCLTYALLSVHIADGGRVKRVYYDNSWGTPEPNTPLGWYIIKEKVRYFDEGIYHEVNLGSAIKEILRQSR